MNRKLCDIICIFIFVKLDVYGSYDCAKSKYPSNFSARVVFRYGWFYFIWKLRNFSHTGWFVRLMLNNAALFARELVLCTGEDNVKDALWFAMGGLYENKHKEWGVIRWVYCNEEVMGKVSAAVGELDARDERVESEKKGRRKYGYCFKRGKGTVWLAKSAIRCFWSDLDSVAEDREDVERVSWSDMK
jgi:hypothetical protein